MAILVLLVRQQRCVLFPAIGDEWNAENGTEPESYVGALYGLINQKMKRES
jgi:hypothetical protein